MYWSCFITEGTDYWDTGDYFDTYITVDRKSKFTLKNIGVVVSSQSTPTVGPINFLEFCRPKMFLQEFYPNMSECNKVSYNFSC